MKQSFFENDKALLTVMVQADNPDRIKELIDKSVPEGAEAFGMQFEQLKSEYRTKEVYKDLFAYAKDKPVYVTNYRHTSNEGKTDDMLAAELVELAKSLIGVPSQKIDASMTFFEMSMPINDLFFIPLAK